MEKVKAGVNNFLQIITLLTLVLIYLQLFLKLPPHHLVDDAHIALDNLHYLGAYVFVHIVRHRDSMLTVLAEPNSSIYCLKETLLIDAGNDEVALVDGFRTFGRGADADGREWMANASEE